MNAIDVYNAHKNQLRGTPRNVAENFDGRSANLKATSRTDMAMELPETLRTLTIP